MLTNSLTGTIDQCYIFWTTVRNMVQRKRSVRRKVQGIIDGDTFKVRNNVNGSQYIRVAGLHAPEKGQRGYASAKQNLSRLKGKTVTLRPKAKSYGRTVADVIYKRKKLSD